MGVSAVRQVACVETVAEPSGSKPRALAARILGRAILRLTNLNLKPPRAKNMREGDLHSGILS